MQKTQISHRLFTEDFPGAFVFVELAAAILVRPSGSGCVFLGMVHEPLCQGRGTALEEVHAAHLENVIDELLDFLDPAEGQVTLEDDTVKTGEDAGNEAGKFLHKARYCVHGILFSGGCLVTTILKRRMPSFHTLLVAALPL